MSGVSKQGKVFIAVMLLLGCLFTVWACTELKPGLEGSQFWLLLGATALAAIAQVRLTEGPTATSSYNMSLAVYGFAFVVLGPAGVVPVILIACLVDWSWHRYPWFIQSLNASVLVLGGVASGTIARLIQAHAVPGPVQTLAWVSAIAVFVLVNHLCVGIAIWLARGESFARSGTFGRMTLLMDATLTATGVVGAIIWEVNPTAVLLAAVPLLLMSAILKVPSLERQATTDAKTGLHNARFFHEALESELARANRLDRPLTVVMGDLDLLRNVNNLYGHLTGDVALKTVASLLRSAVREWDVVARFGGEEFTILMPETAVDDARSMMETVRLAIASTPIPVDSSSDPLYVTMSFGLAARQGVSDTTVGILQRADDALYCAKAEGRNRVRVASPARPAETQCAAPGMPSSEADGSSATPLAVLSPDAVPSRSRSRISTVHDQETKEHRSAVDRRGLSFAGLVFAASLLFAALSLPRLLILPIDLPALALLAGLCLVAEALSIEVQLRDSSVSTAVVPFVAGCLLFGAGAALILSVVIAVAAMVKNHSRPDRFAFNAGSHVVAALAGLWVAEAIGFVEGESPFWVGPCVCVLSSGCYFVVTSGLVSAAISLSGGGNVLHVWMERFRWSILYYVTFGFAAYVMLVAFTYRGIQGVLLVFAAIMAVRFGQKQYMHETRGMMDKLREGNQAIRERADEVSRLNQDLLLALSRAAEMHDPALTGHSERVARCAVRLAEEMGLSEDTQDLVWRLGMLHDIGKLAIPDHIIFKPTRLSAEEYGVIQRHAVCGAGLLGSSEMCRRLAPLVRHHHEHYDGSGYPDRLTGDSIPLEDRIVALADAVEAMSADRPYRPGLTAGDILGEVKANVGTQFDPAVVTAFERLWERYGGLGFMAQADRGGEPQTAPWGEFSAEPRVRPAGYRSSGDAASEPLALSR